MMTWRRSSRRRKPKKEQLGLVTLVTLALSLRQLGHVRLELLQRDDTRRVVQFLFDPGERRWRCATATTLILIFVLVLGPGSTLGLVLGFACLWVRLSRRRRRWVISPDVVDAL